MNPYISSTFANDNTPFKEVLKLLNKNKLYSVEIGSNHAYEESYKYIENYNNFSFLVHNYFPTPKDEFVINIASQNTEIRQRSINHIYKSIDFCSYIGAKLYTFHPGFLTDPGGSNITSTNYDFQWNNELLKSSNFKKNKNNMFRALDEIVSYASKNKVKIAIESEGSLKKKEHLLMQKPEEYIDLFEKYSSIELGVNLNIGHLLLASNAFKFKISDFINLVENNVVAFELSHNDGLEDQHLPLKDNEWYWEYIFDDRFSNVYKILEFRNQTIKNVKKSVNLFNSMRNSSEF